MPKYPLEQFALREDEEALFEVLSKLMQAKIEELASHHTFSLRQLEKGNATMHAFENWCGEDGWGMRTHNDLDELSRRLRQAVNKARRRAQRVLIKRVRKNPHDTRRTKANYPRERTA